MKSKKSKGTLHQHIHSPTLGYIENFPNRVMWKEISESFKGEFKIKYNAGHEVEIHEIIIPHKNWKMNISVSDSRPLKFSIKVHSQMDFKFSISWEGIVEKLFKKLGKKEIEVGWKKFDDHYFISSNRPDLFKKTFTNEVQSIMLKYDLYSIYYSSRSSSKESEILSVIRRRAGDKESILEIIQMHQTLLDKLLRFKVIGS